MVSGLAPNRNSMGRLKASPATVRIDLGYMPEQVQDFYPTPSTISTCMYYTGYDPRTMEPVYVPVNPHEKAMQRALIDLLERLVVFSHPQVNIGPPAEALRRLPELLVVEVDIIQGFFRVLGLADPAELLFVQQSQPPVAAGKLGIFLQCLLVVGDGFVPLAEPLMAPGDVVAETVVIHSTLLADFQVKISHLRPAAVLDRSHFPAQAAGSLCLWYHESEQYEI